MERHSPTRTNLMALRRRIDVTQRGLEVLRGKRDALVRQFFVEMKQAVNRRDVLDAAVREAMGRLAVARGLDGKSALVSAAFRHVDRASVEITERNVWGVRVPEVRYRPPIPAAESGGAAMLGTPVHVEIATSAFERAVEVILASVSPRIRLTRLGVEITRTSRRINALNDVVLPGLFLQVRDIRLALEEREREDLFRTKRFRGRGVSDSAS